MSDHTSNSNSTQITKFNITPEQIREDLESGVGIYWDIVDYHPNGEPIYKVYPFHKIKKKLLRHWRQQQNISPAELIKLRDWLDRHPNDWFRIFNDPESVTDLK